MQSASAYTFFELKEPHNPYMRNRDLNIFVLKFDGTKAAQKNIGAGDPFYCGGCGVCLNKWSKLLGAQQYMVRSKELEKIQEQPQSKIKSEIVEQVQHKFVKPLEMGPKDTAWICEFCGHNNRIKIEKQQVPMQSDMVYIIESASQKIGSESLKDSTIVFCIDNSGSMNTTQQIKGKISLKHGISAHELEMLRQFMEPGDEAQLNYFPGQSSANTFVSRKQCVMAAIESQLSEIQKSDPNKKVGLVTFNNEVVVFGDCMEDSKHILGDKLYKRENILADLAPLSVKMPLKQSYQRILLNINKIEASGATSLGPAVLSAIEIAGKGSPGSAVVICTDGLANIGLGSLDPLTEEAKQFYVELAQRAKQLNIIVNIVTIKGEGCKLQTLSGLALETNGNVSIVSPENIGDDFSNILKDQVVGINVKINIRLPKCLRFRSELKENLKENDSVLEKTLANATVDTKVSFQYELKPEEQLRSLGIDPKKITKLPFQAQVTYTSLQGHKFMRVVTQESQVSSEREMVEKAANLRVVHARVAQQSTALMGSGLQSEAREYNSGWANYIGKNLNTNQDHVHRNMKFLGENEKLEKAYKHKKLKTNLKEKKELRKKVKEEGVQKPANLSDEQEQIERELNLSLANSDEDEQVVYACKHGKRYK